MIKTKKEFRKEMGVLRRAIPEEAILSAETSILKIVQTSDLFQDHQWFYIYVSYKKEFPTHRMIERLIASGKHVAVPKVMGDEMKFFEIESLSDCRPGCMGILEPDSVKEEAMEKGVIILPGLAFDPKGGRMGYGGGFYDKYLERFPDQITVGLLFDLQLVPSVPVEEHDRFMDYLLIPGQGLVKTDSF